VRRVLIVSTKSREQTKVVNSVVVRYIFVMNNYYSLNQIYEQRQKKFIKYVFIINSKIKNFIDIFTKLIYKWLVYL